MNRTTFLIVSDHGFRNVQHTIHPNVLLSQQGLVKRENNVVHCQAWVVPEGGTAMVYINDPNRRRELVSQLHGLFEKVEGVAHVYGQNEYQAIGLPVTAASDQSPDLLLAAKPGYAFGGGDSGELVTPLAEGGSHGYMNTDPNMQAIFIAWGAGIRGGVHLPPIQNRDVASTIAQLLGLQWTGDEGHVLRSILK